MLSVAITSLHDIFITKDKLRISWGEMEVIMNFMKKSWKGIALCLLIAVPAWFLGKQFEVIGGPVFGILLGMIVTFFVKDKIPFAPGITFVSKKVLQYAVILLGFGLNLQTVVKVGATSLPIILATISTSLIMSFMLRKLMKIPGKISTLVGVGSSICGGSAIAATAPVIEADDEEVAQAISVIFLFNIIAALIFPTLGNILGLSNEGFALFAGTAINDTSSVTAAASSWDSIHGTGSEVLDAATIVKLTRTLAIIPITLFLALYRMKKEKSSGNNFSFKKAFPFFILYFIAASILTTICNTLIDSSVITGGAVTAIPAFFSFMKKVSKFFIVCAMSAIGLNTNIVKLIKTGGKPIIMGFCCWVAITCVSLGMQYALGIW